ncbi:hypothetical protein [Streptomyces sp. S1]|uniref:hypothetical protein n=1 Tax=Streptomyces sp. S1 TaxID=718288 RepID=UPI003D73F4CB
MSKLLDDIARRDDRYRHAKPGTPPDLSSHVWSSLYGAYEADLLALRAEYDAPPTPKSAPRLPPAPPAPPSPGPKPGH